MINRPSTWTYAFIITLVIVYCQREEICPTLIPGTFLSFYAKNIMIEAIRDNEPLPGLVEHDVMTKLVNN